MESTEYMELFELVTDWNEFERVEDAIEECVLQDIAEQFGEYESELGR